MPELSDLEFEAVLFREWLSLRKCGGLSGILPGAETTQWVSDHRRLGYATTDYRLIRSIHNAESFSTVPPSFIEKYWSVRTLNGAQDTEWKPSLNVHVVFARNRTIVENDIEPIYRFAQLLRHAAWLSNKAAFVEDGPVELHTKAVFLGRSIGPAAYALCGVESWRGVQVVAGELGYSAKDGFSANVLNHGYEFGQFLDSPSDELIESAAEALTRGDALPNQNYRWLGVNDGPVYDATTGLTTHGLRVL